MASTIQIAVLAETRKARGGLEKVNGSLSGIQKSVKSAGPTLKGVLGANIIGKGAQLAADGLRSLTNVIGDSVAEARESEKVGKTTAQIIKSTGGAAKVTAGQVGDLSTAISNKTGMDDEAIQKGANLLLTFKNVRNEAGKGAAIFDRATGAAADLSAAGFGSVEGASKMLGKALNDPIAGISALGRAGVTFTDQQKDQIKTLVKSGDVLGAQKLIMAEVESQVGGVAEASASAGEKAAVMAGNLKEQFGTVLLPILDKFAKFFITTLGPAISRGIDQIGPIISTISGFIGPVVTKIKELFSAGGGESGGLASYLAAVKNVFVTLGPIVMQVVGAIVSTVRENMPQIMAVFKTIGEILVSVAGIIKTLWTALGPIILPIIKTIFGTAISVISGAFTVISGLFKVISAVLKGDWSGAWNGIRQIVQGQTQIVTAVVRGAMNIVKTVIGTAVTNVIGRFNTMRNSVSTAVQGIKTKISEGFTSAVNTIKDKIDKAVAFVKALPGRAKSALGNLGGLLKGAGADLVAGFVSGISGSIGRVIAKAREVAAAAVRAVKNALDIHSPSRVMEKLGKQTTEGFIVGADTNAVGRLGRSLAHSFTTGFGMPTLAAASGSAGLSGAYGATYQINVTAGVGDPVAMGRAVVSAIDAYERAGGRRKAS